MKKMPMYYSRNEEFSWCDKFFRRVAYTLLLLVVCNVGKTMAQDVQKFTVNFKETRLIEIFDYFEKNSDYTFTYNSANVKSEIIKITESFKNVTLSQILTKCLEKTRFDFEIIDKHVVIKNRRAEAKFYKITGKVVDEKGSALPGVTVLIEGTKIGFASDNKGLFTAMVPMDKGVLILSFVGYKSGKVNFQSGKEVFVTMKVDVSGLDEVTVIAYGERKKREMVGAVSSVKASDIKEMPSSSLESLLQGRMAGVEITNMSGAPGGGGAIVAVRGYNSLIDRNSLSMGDYGEPLYVIDGIPVQGFTSPVTGANTLSAIDPSTIESIEVLKDAASAAIYGSRAGRGVILITTKKGREGDAKFSANVSYSWAYLPSTPDQTGGRAVRDYALKALRNQKRPYRDPVTGAYRFPTNYQEAYGLNSLGAVYDAFWGKAVNGIPPNPVQSPVYTFIQDSLNPFYNNSTNWFKYAFRTGKVLNANIQASGGGNKTTYLIGAGVYNEKGIGYGSDFTRVNLLTNLTVTPVKNFLVDSRVSLTYMGRQRGNANGNTKSAEKIERMPVNPLSSSSFLPVGGWVEEQMLKTINEQSEKNESYDLKASLVLNYDFAPGFRLSVNASASYSLSALNLFKPRTLNKDGLNTSKFEIERRLSVLNENLLSYKKSFNEVHNVDLLAGLSFQKNSGYFNFGQGRGGASDKIYFIYNGFPELPSEGIATEDKILQHTISDFEETAMVSWFARVAYNYSQRYLAEFTYRQDGSSVFGDKNKYANFPALALGWAFSEEKFMDWAWWLSYAKFRASYGKSGEVFPDAYRAHGLMIPGGEFLGRPVMNVDDNAAKNGGMINRELKWIKHDQYDFGLDIDLFDYRLKFKMDYYYRWSTGVVANSKIPKTVYLYENKFVNANDISNEGLELELVGDFVRGTDWSWRMRFNASRNWNRLKKTFDGKDVGPTNGIPLHMLGKPLYDIWAFVQGNVFEKESDIPVSYTQEGNKNTMYLANSKYPFGVGMKQIMDINGDGNADYRDQRNLGQTMPKVYGGWANEVRWKNWDMNVLFNYSLGRKIACMYRSNSMTPKEVIGGANLYVNLDDVRFWEKPGDGAIGGIYPELSDFDNTMLQFGALGGVLSSYVETVNYVKLKQLTIGCNVPKEWSKKVKLDNVRLFFTGENLFTITGYSGTDPEVVSLFNGQDNYRAYPLARKLTLGLTVNF